MRGFGRERVIRSLLKYPSISARAIINTLPERIIEDSKNELYRDYVAKCLRIVTENTAKSCNGSFITADFCDIISPPEKSHNENEIKSNATERIRSKLK